ncbi:TRAP transporter small permease [Tropicibacter naphthalenivorans]|uniref:TRAP transporter small permease protein n=1 Tax=Tropicibacter naphthalenivorans TaxID=441103 RepID=A0A0N7M0G6_9RHOB|nr:TRAP transporter small permease [Tropicibacter naphthalenivorans]CUH80409.1 2,3-diketo-L-gulonate TRAP transporter small permease protein YiaM [Tropicibacter naphthalenivorans]SMC86197.1 C4-dicarboxylate transporter, DctQ subunit [Tropicibacter naphthalenivorans]
MSSKPSDSLLGTFVNELEETFIALILGAMTIITFANVVLRYVFNTGLIWGLEATLFLFAWLVLFGVSYAVKQTANLGVDAVLNIVPPTARRVMSLIAAAVCVAYAFLLLKGAWDYWANFANLPQTTGRWFPTGFEEMKRTSYRSWYEVNDIHMPDILRFIEPWINYGDAYEKMPRFIPYAMLPFGAALLFFRTVQAAIRIWTGQAESLIVSHEAEDDVADVAHLNKED